ncbi:MAG: hypothetical protein KBD78_07140 [Oligoflexales bacterium]|nr:hypothetical protein [Oligoflexales bacterium]
MKRNITTFLLVLSFPAAELFAASIDTVDSSPAKSYSEFETEKMTETQGSEETLLIAQYSGRKSKKKRRKKQRSYENRQTSQNARDFKELRLFLGPVVGEDGNPIVLGADFAMSMGNIVLLGGLDYFSISKSEELFSVNITFLTFNAGAGYIYPLSAKMGLEFGGKLGMISASIKTEPTEEAKEIARAFGEELEAASDSESYMALAPYVRADFKFSDALSLGGELRKPILFDSDAELEGFYLLAHLGYRF